MKFNDSFDKYMSLYNEAKEAPKGKHYDKAGRLQSGDADSDGRGGPKFRSDPTYKNPNEDEEGREFFFGYDIENVHPVEEFVKANYKEGEYGASVGHGDDVMNYLKVNVDLDDERGKKLLDMIEDCDGEGNFDEDDYFEDEEGKKKGLDGKACWDGYELRGTKKKGGKTVDNCVKSSDEESSEDNETAKKIGKGALKVAGRALTGTAKLAGKSAVGVADFVTHGDFSDTVNTIKKAYLPGDAEDCEACGCSDEELEDCETCGCEENPEYGHLDDTYSNYIDQYEAEDGEVWDAVKTVVGGAQDGSLGGMDVTAGAADTSGGVTEIEDCETCGCEDAEAGCECGNCPDCTPKEDNEYDTGEVFDTISDDIKAGMTMAELIDEHGADYVKEFMEYLAVSKRDRPTAKTNPRPHVNRKVVKNIKNTPGPDPIEAEDAEYDMGEVFDAIAADFANGMTKSELEARYGTDAVAKFIKYGDEDGLTASEDGERIDKDKMKCNSPKRGGSKKFVVKACENGKEKIVRFGDPKMRIRKSNPKARKSFRARHKCDQKKSKFSAGYWSCKKW